jgi:hypothetical protein
VWEDGRRPEYGESMRKSSKSRRRETVRPVEYTERWSSGKKFMEPQERLTAVPTRRKVRKERTG